MRMGTGKCLWVGKVTILHWNVGQMLNAHLPFLGQERVSGNTTSVCDEWPVRRQTYGYLPRFILLGDRGTCM